MHDARYMLKKNGKPFHNSTCCGKGRSCKNLKNIRIKDI
jgi:hypothetical protein